MLTLIIRTDKPEAEAGLFNGQEKLGYTTWLAHRELAETIHIKIKDLLNSNQKGLKDIQALVVYQGPGSFTGLRIGLSVANALADSLGIPILAAQTEEWKESGFERLANGENDKLVLPEYGAPPHITQPKH